MLIQVWAMLLILGLISALFLTLTVLIYRIMARTLEEQAQMFRSQMESLTLEKNQLLNRLQAGSLESLATLYQMDQSQNSPSGWETSRGMSDEEELRRAILNHANGEGVGEEVFVDYADDERELFNPEGS